MRIDDTYPSSSSTFSFGLSVFLTWLQLWCKSWAEGGLNVDETPNAHSRVYEVPPASVMNRHNRRVQNRVMRRGWPVARYFKAFEAMGRRDISQTQYMEHLCRLSPLGRIHIYGMRYWRNKFAQRGLEKRFAPNIQFEAVDITGGALWYVHLWPG